MMRAMYVEDLETCLQELVDSFEPTSPPIFIGVNDEVATVSDEVAEIIETAHRLLGEASEEFDEG